jgi:citrate lyase subunit beta/citryl-CoA lyase
MDMRGTTRRSVLSVPATNTAMMARGLEAGADTVFFDLEDSVPAGLKERARANAVEVAPAKRPGTSLGLRINAWSTHWCYRDLIEVIEAAGEHFDYVVVPKADGPADVSGVAGLLGQIEQTIGLGHRILIEPILESGAGLLAAREIIAASDRVFSVVFAPEGLDFAADMHFFDGVEMNYLNATVIGPLAAARAAGVQLVDGPYVALYDLEGLGQTASARFRMGFDGKWAIHPGQIPVLNRCFTPPAALVSKARRTIAAVADAEGTGRGAAVVEDTMVDVASDRVARVALSRSAQLTGRPGDAS